MSEKRFTLVGGKSKFNEILVKVYDNFEEEVIEKQKVVDLLNEQQATISYLEEANPRLQEQLGETLALVDEQQATIDKLKEENEQLKQELAELLAVHTKIVETLDSEFVSKALEDGD